MGKKHALKFLNVAELVATFSPDPAELAWARQHLEPYGATLYNGYDKMIQHPGLMAVVIGTATQIYAKETIKAMENNLHFLCEKLLSTNVDVCRNFVTEARKRLHLKVMCGFSRRFYESYRDAYKKMEQGLIGRSSILRSQTCDKHDPSGFHIAYTAWPGGVFVDMAVHHIDLTLWSFGDDIVPKSVSAHDNAVGIVEFHNGKIAYYYCSQMMARGQEDTTEIVDTEGKLTVNGNAQRNFMNYYHTGGVTREVPAHYYGRFEMALLKEAMEFADACLGDRPR